LEQLATQLVWMEVCLELVWTKLVYSSIKIIGLELPRYCCVCTQECHGFISQWNSQLHTQYT